MPINLPNCYLAAIAVASLFNAEAYGDLLQETIDGDKPLKQHHLTRS